MADKRITDFTEAASAGADYYLVTDSASDGVKKIKPANIVPAFTGDVTKNAGGTVTTIAANAVTNAKAAQMAAGTIKANLTGALASASDNTINSVMDAAFGSVQGAIAYRGASGWSSLAPGVSGQFMQTSGPSANPIWQTIPGGGNMLSSTYDPSGKLADAFDSANTAFLPSGTGAIARTARSKMRDICDLRDFASTFDGVVDNTTPFNNALTQSVDVGAPLNVPAGIINLTSTVTVPQGARIIGSGLPSIARSTVAPTTKQTWLHFNHPGIGFLCDDSAGVTEESRILKGFGTFRSQPEPVPGSPFTPGSFSWDFYLNATSDVFIDEIMLLNPTLGIYGGMSGSTGTASRLTLGRIWGHPLAVGIQIDYMYDVMRIDQLHFWPFWRSAIEVAQYNSLNAIPIIFGRVDNPQIDKFFAWGYASGIKFVSVAAAGVSPGGTCGNFQIGSMQCDFSSNAIHTAPGADYVTGAIGSLIVVGPAALDTMPNAPLALWIEGNGADIRIGDLKCVNAQIDHANIAGSGNLFRIGTLTSQLTSQSSAGAYNHFDVGSGNKLVVGNGPSVDGTGASFIGGSGSRNCSIARAIASGTTDASGDLTVTHGFPFTPAYVNVAALNGNGHTYAHDIGATTFKVRVSDSSGTSLVGVGVSVSWEMFA